MFKSGKEMAMSEQESELKKRGYSLGTLLGEGSYAKVKSAYSDKLQKRVAVKIINRKKAPKDFREKFLPRELKLVVCMNHPYVISTYEIIEFQSQVFIIMEHAGHGDLLEFIKLRGPIPEERAKVMFSQLVDAIDYLHKNKIAHRDLKCENVLLDGMNNLKVTDFGFSRSYEAGDISKTFCGSAAYAAPEVLQGIPYHVPLHDIWSMGVILYIMMCASMPYDDSNIKRMVKDQLEKKIVFSKNKKVSANCKDLIQKIMEVNVKKRASIQAMLEHSWMVDVAGKDKKGASEADDKEKPTGLGFTLGPDANKSQAGDKSQSNTKKTG
ncbi:hypothetical protein ScPMuIL_014400 [Solemya velum]